MLSRIGLSNKLAPRFLSPVCRLSSTTQGKDKSEYEKTKPYNSTEQTNATTTNEVADTDTAYNEKNVNPHEELKQAKEEKKKVKLFCVCILRRNYTRTCLDCHIYTFSIIY